MQVPGSEGVPMSIDECSPCKASHTDVHVRCQLTELLKTSGGRAGVLSTVVPLNLLQASAPGPVRG